MLPSSGVITLLDIQGEFAGSQPYLLTNYYRSGGLVPDSPANQGIPVSGTIAITDFYSSESDTNINVNLTGLSITSGQGTVGLTTTESVTLNGIELSSGQGTVTVDISGGGGGDMLVTSGELSALGGAVLASGFCDYEAPVFNGDSDNPQYGLKGSIVNGTFDAVGTPYTVGEVQTFDWGPEFIEFYFGINGSSADLTGSITIINNSTEAVLFTADFSDLTRQVVDGGGGNFSVLYRCNNVPASGDFYAGLTDSFMSPEDLVTRIELNITGNP